MFNPKEGLRVLLGVPHWCAPHAYSSMLPPPPSVCVVTKPPPSLIVARPCPTPCTACNQPVASSPVTNKHIIVFAATPLTSMITLVITREWGAMAAVG